MPESSPCLAVLVTATLWLGGCDSGRAPGPTAATASATASAAVTRATIRIDEGHDAMKSGAPYSIAPATELVLEGTILPSIDDAGMGPPNSVHVMHGPGEYHRATFTGKWPMVLDAASLDPVKGGPFTGFVAGEPYIVALGAEVTLADGTMKFAPAWVGKVVVALP